MNVDSASKRASRNQVPPVLVALMAAVPLVVLVVVAAANQGQLAGDVSENLPGFLMAFAIGFAVLFTVEIALRRQNFTGRRRYPSFVATAFVATAFVMFCPGCCCLNGAVSPVASLIPSLCYTIDSVSWSTSRGEGFHLTVWGDGNIADHRPYYGMLQWHGQEDAGINEIDWRRPLRLKGPSDVRKRLAPAGLPDAELDALAASIWTALKQVEDGQPVVAPGATASIVERVDAYAVAMPAAVVWSLLLVAAFLVVGRLTLVEPQRKTLGTP